MKPIGVVVDGIFIGYVETIEEAEKLYDRIKEEQEEKYVKKDQTKKGLTNIR